MRKLLKFLGLVLLIPIALFIILIVYATLSDYRPKERELIFSPAQIRPVITDSSRIDLVIWNIGYAGLDQGMDFFYDGGRGVRTSKKKLFDNFSAITTYLKRNDSADFLLLQEVDTRSRRSYRLNQVMELSREMKDHEVFYGKNYHVFFVPVPMRDPMGAVNSGLLSITRLQPSLVERHAFPGQYAWPKRLFMLDRCFLVMRFPVTNGKELVVINTHNEAYDDGSIRDQQMSSLKDFLLSEFNRGNYVVVGGDWNQCPPDFTPRFNVEIFDSINNKGISGEYLPLEWKWIYDSISPTNRRVDIAYTRGKTMTTLIDFFLLSPNVSPVAVKTTDLMFEHSDHQPVHLSIELQ